MIIVGAYWWSFFICNYVPERSGSPEDPTSPVAEQDPELAEDRKPPDPFLTKEELRYCCEVVSVLMLLVQEDRVCIPRPVLPVIAVLLLMYSLTEEHLIRSVLLQVLAQVTYCLMICLQQVWYYIFYVLAVIEGYLI